jgi:hypothetical protein
VLNHGVMMVLSASLCLVLALNAGDFGSARYGSVRATGRQSRYLAVKKHSLSQGLLHYDIYIYIYRPLSIRRQLKMA